VVESEKITIFLMKILQKPVCTLNGVINEETKIITTLNEVFSTKHLVTPKIYNAYVILKFAI